MADDFRYHKVSPRFWTDEKVLRWNDDEKMLALYLLTCPHRTTEGLFRLPKLYMAADLGWSAERLEKPFAKLIGDGFMKYDEAVSIVLLCNALKYQKPENPNQRKGALSKLEELPATPLLWDLVELAEQYAPAFAEELIKHFGKALPEGLGKPQALNSNSNSNSKEECHDSAKAPSDETLVADEGGEEEESPKYPESSEPYKLAFHLRSAILQADSETKVPKGDPKSLQSWATEADRMIRLDNRDPAEAMRLMDWCQQDTFWRGNILSMAKFRKHYDKLKRQAERASPKREQVESIGTYETTKDEWGWE